MRTSGRFFGLQTTRPVRSASVVKAMLMLAYLRRPDVRERPLGRADRALLDPMIRRSSNDAADRTYVVVGATGLERVARRARMRRFAAGPGGFWGGSTIDARDQTRLFLRIDRLVPRRHRAYAMRLLRTIVPRQRWGVGAVAPRGWRLHFKGGWGSGSGAVDHQVALLTRDGLRVSVAVMTTGNASHRDGKRTLRGIFARLLRGLGRVSGGGRG